MRRSFGSIQEIKRGEVYRLHWCVDGKRMSKRIRGTKKDAERELAAIYIGNGGTNERTTFDEYWKGAVEPTFTRLSAKTVSEYNRTWNKELQPRIGHLRVADMNFRKAQSVILSVEAPSVQAKCRMLLHKICRIAVEQDGILQTNPVTRDTITEKPKKKTKELVEASDVRDFMGVISGLKYELLFLCQLGGGLRTEEACALRHPDISTDGEYVYINIFKTLVTVDGKKLLQDRTKTETSEREVVIGEPFASRISELLEDSDKPICAGIDGEYTSPATITHNWRQYCTRNGIKYVNQGSLRSSWSQMMSEAGAPDSLVALAMGHTDGTTRGKHYLKATRKSNQLIADILRDYLDENY